MHSDLCAFRAHTTKIRANHCFSNITYPKALFSARSYAHRKASCRAHVLEQQLSSRCRRVHLDPDPTSSSNPFCTRALMTHIEYGIGSPSCHSLRRGGLRQHLACGYVEVGRGGWDVVCCLTPNWLTSSLSHVPAVHFNPCTQTACHCISCAACSHWSEAAEQGVVEVRSRMLLCAATPVLRRDGGRPGSGVRAGGLVTGRLLAPSLAPRVLRCP